MPQNIGLDVKAPEKECKDRKCPFHGEVKVRGQLISGVVESTSMKGSVTLVLERKRKVKKYERKETRFSKYHAHLPSCMNIQVGDKVRIGETRKLAKSISYVVIEKVNP